MGKRSKVSEDGAADAGFQQVSGAGETRQTGSARRRRSMSMHDGIAVWCDCCSCQAEPYWAELAEEMGIDLGSDYEADDAEPGRQRN